MALIAASAALRLLVVWRLPPFPAPAPGGYAQGLHDHALQYLQLATLLPPLNYLLQALPMVLLGPEGNAANHGSLYLGFSMDVTAVWLIYRGLRVVDVPVAVSWVLAFALSVVLIPFEMWRASYPGEYYDHYTPLLASFLVFACLRAARFGLNRRNIALVATAGVLLILQLPTAAYFVPGLFVVILATERLTGRLRSRPLATIATLLGPALIAVALLTLKNGLVAGVPAPGAKGGAALMMFVQEVLDKDRAAVRQLAVDAGAPSWYLWCYDHPVLPPGVFPGTLWDRLSPAFGICMPFGSAPNIAGTPWPFDFGEVIRQLETAGRPDLAARVAQDQSDALSRQYLSMGHSPELSPRWIAIYGQESQRVGLHLLRTQTRRYFETMRNHHDYMFWGTGPEFPARVASELKTFDYPYREELARFARFGFPAAPRAAYLLLPYACVLALLALVVYRRRGWPSEVPAEALRIYLWLGFPVFMCALFYSGAVAVENDRYFVQILPYLIAALGIMSSHVGGLVSRRA